MIGLNARAIFAYVSGVCLTGMDHGRQLSKEPIPEYYAEEEFRIHPGLSDLADEMLPFLRASHRRRRRQISSSLRRCCTNARF